jgi:hypothetical protein
MLVIRLLQMQGIIAKFQLLRVGCFAAAAAAAGDGGITRTATRCVLLLLLLLLLLTHRCWAGCCWVVGPLGGNAPAPLLVSLLHSK